MRWHRHTWKVVEKDEQPSFLDAMKTLDVTEMEYVPLDGHERPVIVTYRCDCGAEKVKRV